METESVPDGGFPAGKQTLLLDMCGAGTNTPEYRDTSGATAVKVRRSNEADSLKNQTEQRPVVTFTKGGSLLFVPDTRLRRPKYGHQASSRPC